MSASELATLITAATSAIVAILNAFKNHSTARKLKTTHDITVKTQATTKQIKTLVNGQSEALRRALEAAQERCQALETENAQLKGRS
jgi:hypothetical protein